VLIFYIHNKNAPHMSSCNLPVSVLSVKISSESFFKLKHFHEYYHENGNAKFSVGALVYVQANDQPTLGKIGKSTHFLRYLEIPGFYASDNRKYECKNNCKMYKKNSLLNSVESVKTDGELTSTTMQEFKLSMFGRSCLTKEDSESMCTLVSVGEYYRTVPLQQTLPSTRMWYAVNTKLQYNHEVETNGADEDGMAGYGSTGNNAYEGSFNFQNNKKDINNNMYIMIVAFLPDIDYDFLYRRFLHRNDQFETMGYYFGTPAL
jgi:hypothetical protein